MAQKWSARGLLEKIFGSRPNKQAIDGAGKLFEALTAYSPRFTTWGGELYESELVRSAIDARARHISKLMVTFQGTAKPKLRTQVKVAPNEFMTWPQFLYRTSTILDMENTCFIIPMEDGFGDAMGYFPILPSRCELVEVDGEIWARYQFSNGQFGALPLDEVGVLTKFQFKDDFFGESNRALTSTMKLIDMQNQGIEQGIKNSATFRFMARLSNFSKPEDLAKERRRFNQENLQDESGGVLLWPNTYADIKELKSTPFVVDAEQMKLIQTNVYNYFGVNEDVLQNKAYGDSWSAFFDGAIEPFAVQLSDVMSRMTFSGRERATGNGVYFTANRLQYASTTEKLNVSAQMADRGIMSRNEIREIWGLPPIDGGDIFLVRGEYKDPDNMDNTGNAASDSDTLMDVTKITESSTKTNTSAGTSTGGNTSAGAGAEEAGA